MQQQRPPDPMQYETQSRCRQKNHKKIQIKEQQVYPSSIIFSYTIKIISQVTTACEPMIHMVHNASNIY